MAQTTGKQTKLNTEQSLICGVVRPIAAWDGCSFEHWADIHDIVAEACLETGYSARVVSEMTGASVIQAEIVNNIYSDPVIICDVSGRNPNVMFELGMRVAFQKPVIVIVDDATDFSFDISPLRHIIYRRDREYKSIVRFKEQVVEALRNVDNLTGYLSQFGDIHVSNIGDRTVSIEEMAKDLSVMAGQMSAIDRKINEVIQSNLSIRNQSAHDDLIGTSRSVSAAGGALVTRDMIEAARKQLDLTTAARNAARASAKVSQQIAKGLDPLNVKLG